MNTFHFRMDTFHHNITARDILHWIKIFSRHSDSSCIVTQIRFKRKDTHIDIYIWNVYIYIYIYNICMNSNNLKLLIWAFLSCSRPSIFVFSNILATISTLLCKTQMKRRRDTLTMSRSYCSEIFHIDTHALSRSSARNIDIILNLNYDSCLRIVPYLRRVNFEVILH